MPASKAQQKAVHKYTKENYDRFLVTIEVSNDNAEYTGTAITPVIVIKDGETVLDETATGTVSYTVAENKDLINAGTYTLKVSTVGGNYAAIVEKEVTFKIPVGSGENDPKDKDSQPGNVEVPETPKYPSLPDYKDGKSDENTYIPGQQDDDDFEKLVIVTSLPSSPSTISLIASCVISAIFVILVFIVDERTLHLTSIST